MVTQLVEIFLARIPFQTWLYQIDIPSAIMKCFMPSEQCLIAWKRSDRNNAKKGIKS